MEVYTHRVRYNEVDEQGIVFNSHYLTWCDHAIYEYFRINGWSPIELKKQQVDLVLRKVEIDYIASAHLDDLLRFDLEITRLGNSSFDAIFSIILENEVLVTVKIIYINVINGQSQPIPIPVRTYMEKHM